MIVKKIAKFLQIYLQIRFDMRCTINLVKIQNAFIKRWKFVFCIFFCVARKKQTVIERTVSEMLHVWWDENDTAFVFCRIIFKGYVYTVIKDKENFVKRMEMKSFFDRFRIIFWRVFRWQRVIDLYCEVHFPQGEAIFCVEVIFIHVWHRPFWNSVKADFIILNVERKVNILGWFISILNQN